MVIPRLQRQHLWLSRALILCFSWPPPNLREAHEVITKVKSYCATETGARGGKKSWQKISGVSLERFRKWEETEQIGEKGLREELAEVEAEEGLKWRWRESAWNKDIKKRELSAEGVRVIAVEERERQCWCKEVKDIFSGSRPSWCLCWTATGVRSLFQPWRQL